MSDQFSEFCIEARATYAGVVDRFGSKLVGGKTLLQQLDNAIASKAGRDQRIRQVTEKLNELAVAKHICEDQTVDGLIEYEPKWLTNNCIIDFVAHAGGKSIYIEVKTVQPQFNDTAEKWEAYLWRSKSEPDNAHFVVQKEWMGAALHNSAFVSRVRFLEYALQFEDKLANAKSVRNGPGILVFCGNNFHWHSSQLEDFVDFYHSGAFRQDDSFRDHISQKIADENVTLKRNIDHFACMIRDTGKLLPSQFLYPVCGPIQGR